MYVYFQMQIESQNSVTIYKSFSDSMRMRSASALPPWKNVDCFLFRINQLISFIIFDHAFKRIKEGCRFSIFNSELNDSGTRGRTRFVFDDWEMAESNQVTSEAASYGNLPVISMGGAVDDVKPNVKW